MTGTRTDTQIGLMDGRKDDGQMDKGRETGTDRRMDGQVDASHIGMSRERQDVETSSFSICHSMMAEDHAI